MHIVGALQGGVSKNMENLPYQGVNVKKTRVRINLWAEIDEEKLRHVPKQLNDKIQETIRQ